MTHPSTPFILLFRELAHDREKKELSQNLFKWVRWASSCCCLHRRTIFDCFRVCDADSWRVSACVVWFSYTLITRGDGRLVRDPLSLISLLVSFRSLPPARSHTRGTQISSTWIGNFSVLLFFCWCCCFAWCHL